MSTEERFDAYAKALLTIAQAEGNLSEVEDELFRFARIFEGSDELRMALTDPLLPAERRQAVIEDLLEGKALQTTKAMVSFVVAIGRASELPAIVDRFVALSAQHRKHEVAEVRTAVELNPEQLRRLSEALGKATGKQVEVKVVIDPTVLGGVFARIGDTVIDGTVRSRIEQLKEQL
ncbi:MAG: synthase, delta subunit [Actinomycetia bacterium]|jgi:F-type H+-transporting ATPase subunit delta|nr:synthase, delta subunit [Actinomycetes bacterium]